MYTFWLLNVSTTLSAPSLVSNTNSAMTFGCSAMMTQLMTTPPTGVIALSMSAAVVPGARFFATTGYGPASPRIDIPAVDFDLPTMLNWLLRAGDEAVLFNALRNRSPCVLRPALGPRGGICVFLADEGLLSPCKSCVHSELTLPAGRGDALGDARAVEAVRLQSVRTMVLPPNSSSWSYLLDTDSAGEGATGNWLAIGNSCAGRACSTILAKDILRQRLCLTALAI